MNLRSTNAFFIEKMQMITTLDFAIINKISKISLNKDLFNP